MVEPFLSLEFSKLDIKLYRRHVGLPRVLRVGGRQWHVRVAVGRELTFHDEHEGEACDEGEGYGCCRNVS